MTTSFRPFLFDKHLAFVEFLQCLKILLVIMTTNVMHCAICCHLYNLKNLKNTYGEVLILAKLQASAFNFAKSSTPPWVF